MKNSAKILIASVCSLVLLTGCLGSSGNPIEGEWEVIDTSSTELPENMTLIISSDAVKTEMAINNPGSDKNMTVSIEFDYKVIEEDGNEFTLEPSNFTGDVDGGSLTEEQKEEMNRQMIEDMETGADEKTIMRVNDDKDRLFWSYAGGDELEFKKV
jgi:hypothetical protein